MPESRLHFRDESHCKYKELTMPYTLATLPDAVKKLSQELKEAWMKAFNSAYAQYKDDGKASATAWSIVKKMGYVNMESYKKDLLIAGEYPHPQDKKRIIKMDMNRLNKIADNTQRFLLAGGKIPITISHPKSEKDKINTTQGWLEEVWVDEDTKRLSGKLNIEGEADQWIKDGKLKAVSPGVYHDVVTSAGIFPMLIDHVALTSSPHNLGQFGFLPMNAESFSSAEIFFENYGVSYQIEGDAHGIDKTLSNGPEDKEEYEMDELQKALQLLNNLKKLIIALVTGKKEQEGIVLPGDESGNGGNGVIPKTDIVAALKDLGGTINPVRGGLSTETEVLSKLLLERDTLEKKVKELENIEKKRLETTQKETKDNFEKRMDEDISLGLIKPELRTPLIEEYDMLSSLEKKTMNFEGKEISIEDYILSRYETDKESKLKTVLKPDLNHIKFENRTYDLTTEEGRDALHKMKKERAKELAKGTDKKWGDFFEQAHDEIEEEIFGEKE